jgi:hypothetical protein
LETFRKKKSALTKQEALKAARGLKYDNLSSHIMSVIEGGFADN